MKNITLYLIVLLLVGCSANKFAKENLSILKYKYELNTDIYKEDKLNVKLELDNLNEETITYCFPKIVPGIYGAMDFGQYINFIDVKDKRGNSLVSKKTDENCWEISNAKQIYSIEYEVDDTWEEFDFGILKRGFYGSAASTFKEDVFVINPNCIFGYFRGYDSVPIEIVVNKPKDFYGATSLRKTASEPNQDKFKADSYHQLVDNPILYALPDTSIIQLPNIEIEVACYSTTDKPISKEIANYIKPLLVNQAKYLDNKLPVDRYTFILYHNINPDENSYVADGLEHSRSSIILLYMPMDLDIIKENVYGIASHEFFHTLMPLGIHSHEIANYDFNNPKFSRHLWLYEGTTEYFTIHMPIKNGLQNVPDFLQVIEQKITEMKAFDNTLSFTELSLNPMGLQDEYYSVYSKGALINLCLDIKLRELSNGAYGVQELVLDLIEKYGVDKSFEDENLFDEIISITGFPELRKFFDEYVIESEELPLKEMLYKVGLILEDDSISEIEQLTSAQKTLRKSWINR